MTRGYQHFLTLTIYPAPFPTYFASSGLLVVLMCFFAISTAVVFVCVSTNYKSGRRRKSAQRVFVPDDW